MSESGAKQETDHRVSKVQSSSDEIAIKKILGKLKLLPL